MQRNSPLVRPVPRRLNWARPGLNQICFPSCRRPKVQNYYFKVFLASIPHKSLCLKVCRKLLSSSRRRLMLKHSFLMASCTVLSIVSILESRVHRNWSLRPSTSKEIQVMRRYRRNYKAAGLREDYGTSTAKGITCRTGRGGYNEPVGPVGIEKFSVQIGMDFHHC
jgi:hypothetical protein